MSAAFVALWPQRADAGSGGHGSLLAPAKLACPLAKVSIKPEIGTSVSRTSSTPHYFANTSMFS